MGAVGVVCVLVVVALCGNAIAEPGYFFHAEPSKYTPTYYVKAAYGNFGGPHSHGFKYGHHHHGPHHHHHDHHHSPYSVFSKPSSPYGHGPPVSSSPYGSHVYEHEDESGFKPGAYDGSAVEHSYPSKPSKLRRNKSKGKMVIKTFMMPQEEQEDVSGFPQEELADPNVQTGSMDDISNLMMVNMGGMDSNSEVNEGQQGRRPQQQREEPQMMMVNSPESGPESEDMSTMNPETEGEDEDMPKMTKSTKSSSGGNGWGPKPKYIRGPPPSSIFGWGPPPSSSGWGPPPKVTVSGWGPPPKSASGWGSRPKVTVSGWGPPPKTSGWGPPPSSDFESSDGPEAFSSGFPDDSELYSADGPGWSSSAPETPETDAPGIQETSEGGADRRPSRPSTPTKTKPSARKPASSSAGGQSTHSGNQGPRPAAPTQTRNQGQRPGTLRSAPDDSEGPRSPQRQVMAMQPQRQNQNLRAVSNEMGQSQQRPQANPAQSRPSTSSGMQNDGQSSGQTGGYSASGQGATSTNSNRGQSGQSSSNSGGQSGGYPASGQTSSNSQGQSGGYPASGQTSSNSGGQNGGYPASGQSSTSSGQNSSGNGNNLMMGDQVISNQDGLLDEDLIRTVQQIISNFDK